MAGCNSFRLGTHNPSATNASFTPSTTQPTEVAGAGITTFTAIDFLAGTAAVCVGANGDTADPISVTIDGAAMTKVASTGTGDRMTIFVKSGISAGNHDIIVDRTSTGNIKAMTGTLQNIANPTTPVDTALLSVASHSSPHDATSQLDIAAGGIGLVYMSKAAGQAWSAARGGVTFVADSIDGNRKLGTMTASGVPGFAAGTSGSSGLISAAWDKA